MDVGVRNADAERQLWPAPIYTQVKLAASLWTLRSERDLKSAKCGRTLSN